jgi:acyl carrier protein
LEVAPSDIAPGEALFYDGLGLDSIDALELALEISQKYGFEMRAEDEENQRIFASLRNLTEHIESNRVR